MDLDLALVQDRIEPLASAVSVEKIVKGFSADQKYRVATQDGTVYLLRVSSLSQLARKQDEFHILQHMRDYQVQSPVPVSMGPLPDLQLCYYVVSYVEGEDAQDALPGYSQQVQFDIGAAAGRDLRRMHHYIAPPDISPWRERLIRKHRKYVDAYRTSGIVLKHADAVSTFIDDHLRYIQQSANVFQHDDFHVGNLIVRDGAYSGVIDFNRYDWGDPIHDMVKVGLFSREISVPFANGQLQGYFAGDFHAASQHQQPGKKYASGDFPGEQPPEHFWETYAVYVAMTVIASVVWTLQMTPEQMDSMMERLYLVMEDHKQFTLAKPAWAE